MKKTILEGVLSVVAFVLLWLAPPSWRPLAYVLLVAAVIVALSSYLDSRRRVKESEAAVEIAKRNLDELRKKQG